MNRRRLLVIGCGGKMGGRVLALAADDPTFDIVGAVTERGDPRIGRDAGAIHDRPMIGIAVGDDYDGDFDVAIEFSTPAGCVAWAQRCAQRGLPLVSGTTGLSESQRAELASAAGGAAIFWSPNMSVGANLLMRLAAEAAGALGEDCHVEIVEAHHAAKVDAPSGTANALLQAICRASGREAASAAVFGRSGRSGPRRAGEIGVHSLRLGNVVGDHEVHFSLGAESLILRHSAQSRDAFAAGALRAASWLIGRPKGSYGMSDLLQRHG